MESSREVHFDGWTLYRTAGELVKGDTRTRLQTQPLMILEELLAQPGELVTRERLIARLWPRGIVDFDTALNSAVHRLRTALADNPEAPRYIETIPRRGYRFIGRLDPSPVAPSAMPDPPVEEAAVPAVAGAKRGPAHRRWPQAAAGLLFAILAITAFVFLRTGEPQSERGVPEGATSAEAQERFQRAEYFFQRRAPGDIDLARKYYAAAIEIDPGFARAWTGLAGAYWIDTVEGRLAPEQGEFDEAVALQRRAVEADPVSTLRRYNLAAILYRAGRLDEAKVELLELRELSPTPGRFSDLLGLVLILEGRYDEALEMVDEWSDELICQQGQALAYHGLGRNAEADAALRRLIDSSQGEDQILVAEVYAFRGEIDAAFERLQAASAHVDDAPWMRRSRRWLTMMPYSSFLRALHTDPRWDIWRESVLERWSERPRSNTQRRTVQRRRPPACGTCADANRIVASAGVVQW